MREHYILADNHEILTVDLATWAEWFGTNKKRVRLTQVGKYSVSTVFLGLDHNWEGGPPLVFETMAFDARDNEVTCERCSTWDQALIQHQEVVDSLKNHDAQETQELSGVVKV